MATQKAKVYAALGDWATVAIYDVQNEKHLSTVQKHIDELHTPIATGEHSVELLPHLHALSGIMGAVRQSLKPFQRLHTELDRTGLQEIAKHGPLLENFFEQAQLPLAPELKRSIWRARTVRGELCASRKLKF